MNDKIKTSCGALDLKTLVNDDTTIDVGKCTSAVRKVILKYNYDHPDEDVKNLLLDVDKTATSTQWKELVKEDVIPFLIDKKII